MSIESQEIKPITQLMEGPLRRGTHTYDLMRQCIHCGFCLPTCPTYAVLGVEMDSPRGRIYQMQAIAEGRMEIGPDFIEHMYCCLGCRACETACPSGVQFGKLIESAREEIEAVAPQQHGGTERVLRSVIFGGVLPSRLLTSLLFTGLKLYQRSGAQTLARKLNVLDSIPGPLAGKLQEPEALMPRIEGALFQGALPVITHALGERRYRVGFISGCIMDQVFRDINEASIRVLAANGCEVITPPEQRCCGALHVHSGEAEQGRALARANIDVFERWGCDYIIINSAGCGSNLKEYGHLLRDDPGYAERAAAFSTKVKDISEFLALIDLNPQLGEIKRRVTYHDACHLAHGQKIKNQPRALLKRIPGLELVDLKEADWCCGSAGIYNITNQEMAGRLLSRKMGNIEATRAQVVATGNPGCMIQINFGARQRELPIQALHPVQLLDEAYRVGGAYTVPAPKSHNREVLIGLGIGAALVAAAVLLSRSKPRRG
ncbi:MAG TPA: heterodisulfide reductase-related iron-sulfur binding cluster [Ktedonobacterales bacterium]|nr:heterodisulfide reductase-related iron-sulfur binding cluster [Ktedonobacterales bacterium]